jgi:hypothetical protein
MIYLTDIGVGLVGMVLLGGVSRAVMQAIGQPIDGWINLGIFGMILVWKRIDDKRYQSSLERVNKRYEELAERIAVALEQNRVRRKGRRP